VHFGPRFGIEKYGEINAVNSGSESGTGIDAVAGCVAVMLITQRPLVKHRGVRWASHYVRDSKRSGVFTQLVTS
jgi:hypothetical protein